MAAIFYEVIATARDDTTASEWLDWTRSSHLADVVSAGAKCGRVVRLDEPARTFAAQYEFESREAFERYLQEHAPRLRAEGIERFGDRVTYSRRAGVII